MFCTPSRPTAWKAEPVELPGHRERILGAPPVQIWRRLSSARGVCKSPTSSNSASLRVSSFLPGYPLYTNFSAFAQDEWRVTQRLNLSLGLRWEVNPPPDVTQGLKPYT